jgi:GntR family transcriptional repressor for pyruvate dehydrogenase complex
MPFLSILSPLFFKDKSYETELLEFRIVLELRAVESAARNMAPGRDAPIAAALELMREALDADDADLGAEADIAFHRAVFSLADNSIIAKAADLLSSMLEFSVRSSRRRILERVDDREKLYRQHRDVWSSLREGDPAKAAEAMRVHLAYALDFHFT